MSNAIPGRPNSKVCIQCEERKPMAQFTNRKESPDGKFNTCKTCVRDNQAERRARQSSYDYSLCSLMAKWGRPNADV